MRTTTAAGVSRDAPSNSPATSDGDNSGVTPIDVSITALTINRSLATVSYTKNIYGRRT